MAKTMHPDNEDDNVFWADYGDNIWTLQDQKSLVSVDGLFARLLEFHSNVHSFGGWEANADGELDTSISNDMGIAIEVSYFDNERFIKSKKVSFKSLESVLADIQQYAESGLLWINIRDLRALTIINKFSYLEMHHICQSGFHDLRAHSTILPTASGSFLLTLCTYRLVGTDAKLFKTYMYRHNYHFDELEASSEPSSDNGVTCRQSNIIMTYEHELMPDLNREFVEVFHPLVSVDNPLGGEAIGGGPGYRGVSDKDEGDVLSTILGRVQSMNPERVNTVGPMYLIYEIAMEALIAEDTLVEFFSRTLCYFKTKVHNNLQHEEKLVINRKMHIIISAMLVMSSSITESASCFMRLLDPPQALKHILESNRQGGGSSNMRKRIRGRGYTQQTSSNMTQTSPTTSAAVYNTRSGTHPHRFTVSLAEEEHIPYIYHLMDAYDFSKQCISNSIESARGLHQTMDAVAQLRTDHTATTLSLIATVFLPLTFLSGVFGMNFQEEGGYTIHLLNDKNGPRVFYFICICCFIVCVAYFMKQGWISPIFLPSFIRRKLNWCMGESVLKDDDRYYEKSASGEHNNLGVRAASSKRGSEYAESVAARRYDVVRTKRSLVTLGKQERTTLVNRFAHHSTVGQVDAASLRSSLMNHDYSKSPIATPATRSTFSHLDGAGDAPGAVRPSVNLPQHTDNKWVNGQL